MHNKKVVYTALFGDRGKLFDPKVSMSGWDFVCFTNRTDLKSKIWDVRVVDAPLPDMTRSNRFYKILAHKAFPEYEVSVYMDANLQIKKDLTPWVEEHLAKAPFAVHDHKNNEDSVDCVYDELEHILEMQKRGRFKDDPDVMKKQIQKYRDEGYPEKNGMAVTMVLIRRHNDPQVIEAMEKWWEVYSNNSRRDQLSFNYSAWKTHLPFVYLPGDSRKSEWFLYHSHETVSFLKRLKRFLKRFV